MSVGDRFKAFTTIKYSDQAKAFLNAYWDEASGDAETIWGYTHQFIELDHVSGKEGFDLDEFNAHRFLEKLGESRTVKQMRDELREIDMDFNKRMALLEYFLWSYRKTVSDFLSKPQGGADPEEINEAQRLLDEVQRLLAESQRAADEARAREEQATRDANEARDRELEAKADEDEAKSKEAIALEAEAPFRIAQEELEAALNELHAQEDAYRRRSEELQARIDDPNLGVVQKNKAKNELSQHTAQDPLPLRQAKLTTEAAERKADKVRKPFKETREIAEQARAKAERTAHDAVNARKEAEDSAHEAIQSRQLADNAVDECVSRLQEAESYLHEVMNKPTNPQGQMWWIQRELDEARKFLPKKARF